MPGGCGVQSSFDITGQGTILSAGPSSAPATPMKPLAAHMKDAAERRAKTARCVHACGCSLRRRQQKLHAALCVHAHAASYRVCSRIPNKKQQMKQALAVQSAHLITADYTSLSQPSLDGMLLMDQTDHKLKLIHSLGELQPLHTHAAPASNPPPPPPVTLRVCPPCRSPAGPGASHAAT